MGDLPKYKVLVSGRARDALFEHARFLAQASIKAGEELFDQFEKRIASLEEVPERCAFYNNPYVQRGKYRWLSLGKYLMIVFQVVGEVVYIELVFDGRAENVTLFDV